MCKKSAYSVSLALLLCLACSVMAMEEFIDPANITATASSVNHQLEPIYSCDGSGLTGDLHTNRISTGSEPPPPGEGTMWLAESSGAGTWIQYGFDEVYVLSTMWVWNYNQVLGDGGDRTGRGISNCTIEYSLDGSNWTKLGDTHAFARADGSTRYIHNTEIDFGNVRAKYVKITVISNHGDTCAGLSEVRFYTGTYYNTVAFETASSEAFEPVSPAVINVVLAEPEEQTVTVDYAVTGGTATGGGVDYLLAGSCDCDFDGSGQVDFRDIKSFAEYWLSETPGNPAEVSGDSSVTFSDFAVCASQWLDTCGNTLSFAPGETSKTISIDIVDDGINEEDETIIVELSNPTGGNVELGPVNRHTYTIMDTQPRLSFDGESSGDSESVTAAVFPVILSYPSSEVITVDYAVTGGTATGGSVDYSLRGTTLTFNPGETNKAIYIHIKRDDEIEENETIELTLSNPTNAVLGPPVVHTYTIFDDEIGVWFDGMRWMHSEDKYRMRLDEEGRFEWIVDKGGQVVVNMPERRFSQAGDVVTFSYILTSTGDVDYGCECYKDYNPDPDAYNYCTDIRCVGGTGDFRIGLFDSNGKGYITRDNMGPNNEIFRGYLGYHVRAFPHVPQDARSRFTEYKTGGGSEAHTNTSLWERSNPTGNSALLSNSNSWNRLESPMTGGFGIPVGGSALFTFRLERTSSSGVKISITCNGKTWSKSSESDDTIPDKIDVFAMYANSGEYDYIKFAIPEQ